MVYFCCWHFKKDLSSQMQICWICVFLGYKKRAQGLAGHQHHFPGQDGNHGLLIPERRWPSSSPLRRLSISPFAVNKISQKMLGEELAFCRWLLVMMAFSQWNSLLWRCLQNWSVWAVGCGGMMPRCLSQSISSGREVAFWRHLLNVWKLNQLIHVVIWQLLLVFPDQDFWESS